MCTQPLRELGEKVRRVLDNLLPNGEKLWVTILRRAGIEEKLSVDMWIADVDERRAYVARNLDRDRYPQRGKTVGGSYPKARGAACYREYAARALG